MQRQSSAQISVETRGHYPTSRPSPKSRKLGYASSTRTCDFLDGKEAERIDLVSMAVPSEELMPKAMEVAEKLATGSQSAIRWTKRSLNQWLRMAAQTSFDYSLALEILGFFEEGLQSLKERRGLEFPSAR